MIVVTGGEGFIGKNVILGLRRLGYRDIVSLDVKTVPIDVMYDWLGKNRGDIDFIYHFGAITDTTETNTDVLDRFNIGASKFIWDLCVANGIPLVYASSAATYGDGRFGFDDQKPIDLLRPLNPYGWSKHQFDLWVGEQKNMPPYWYGLKFFNVYGYGESHKGRMASVVYNAYCQILKTGQVSLFKSYNPSYGDGFQLRDFVYIDDVVDACIFMMERKPISGIYNVGTGKARSFIDLVRVVFRSLGMVENINFIDIPMDIRDKYQYFTEAKITKLVNSGYGKRFYELEEGIEEYLNKLQYENC